MGLGYRDFAPGYVPTANDFDGYLMRQTVMVFASEAARNTALSGVLAEGMMSYQQDTNLFTYYTGAVWLVISGRLGCTLAQSGQSIGSGATATLTYNTEVEDTGNYHASAGQVIVPTGRQGMYSVTFHADPGTAVSALCDVVINVSGSEVANGYIAVAKRKFSVSCTLPLAVGDVVTGVVFNGHSTSLSFIATMRCYFVGPA